MALLRAEVGEEAPAPAAVTPAPAASAPPPGPGVSDGAKEALRELDLLPIYRNWFSPLAERQGGGGEVNLSCFNTSFHTSGDRNPQFGINTSTNLYYCHACQVRGDIVDLAAVYYGLAGPDHRALPDKIHEVVKFAGEELLGMKFHLTPAGYQRIPDLGAIEIPAAAPTGAGSGVLTLAVLPAPGTDPMAGYVAPTYTGPAPAAPTADDGHDAAEEARIKAADFTLDWRSFVPDNTPLRRYMDTVCADDTPEEFHMWNYMGLIGLTLGRTCFLPDSKPVHGNLLTCIIGRSGQGKSRSEGYIDQLISEALPFNEEDHMTTGVRVIKNPGSGEFLSARFQHEIPDPTFNPKDPGNRGKRAPMLVNPGVKAIVRWPEMATMIGKSAGKGSIVQQTIIELYDVPRSLGGGSLTHGSYEALDPYGTVATTTQLATIRNLVTRDDAASGFLNRWLFVVGRSKQFQPWGSNIDVTPLAADVHALRDWAGSIYRQHRGWLPMDPEALAESSEFLVTIAHPLEAGDSEMLRRATLTFKKLLLLFSANMMEDSVSLKSVSQAKIAFTYLMDCLRHIGVRLETSEEVSFEDDVLELIGENPQGIRPRDLRKKLRARGSAQDVNRVLAAMEQADIIQLTHTKTTPGPGAPTKRYILCE